MIAKAAGAVSTPPIGSPRIGAQRGEKPSDLPGASEVPPRGPVVATYDAPSPSAGPVALSSGTDDGDRTGLHVGRPPVFDTEPSSDRASSNSMTNDVAMQLLMAGYHDESCVAAEALGREFGGDTANRTRFEGELETTLTSSGLTGLGYDIEVSVSGANRESEKRQLIHDTARAFVVGALVADPARQQSLAGVVRPMYQALGQKLSEDPTLRSTLVESGVPVEDIERLAKLFKGDARTALRWDLEGPGIATGAFVDAAMEKLLRGGTYDGYTPGYR